MDSIQVKVKFITLVFVCVAGGIFISGCSMHHHTHHDYEAKMLPSGEAMVISLTNNPEYQQLLGGKPQTSGMRSGRVYLQPGQTCGQHSTEQHEEMLVFLSGRGLVLIGENDSFQVGQGKISYIPPHTIHNIKNTGTEPLVYIYCVAPVQLDAEDHPAHEEHHH